MKKNNFAVIALCMILSCALLSGCGKKKEVDEASSQVIQISVAPEVTPTLAPDQVSSDAVVTNGNMTMVNEYLADQNTSAETVSDSSSNININTDSTEDSSESDRTIHRIVLNLAITVQMDTDQLYLYGEMKGIASCPEFKSLIVQA